MVLLMVTASGVGGFSATYFLNPKGFKSEVNHSTGTDSSASGTEKMSSEKTSADHVDEDSARSHSDHDDHASNDGPNSSHGRASERDRGGVTEANHHENPSVVGIASGPVERHGESDPFGEDALNVHDSSSGHAAVESPVATKDSIGREGHSSHDFTGHQTSAVEPDVSGGDALVHADEAGRGHRINSPDHAEPQATTLESHDLSEEFAATLRDSGMSDAFGHDHDQKAPQLSDSHARRKQVLDHNDPVNELPEEPSRQDRMTQQAVNFMSMADEELAAGNYVEAMRAYQSLRKQADGVPGPALLFRLALCAEAAGRHAAAIEAYRRISGTQSDPAWVGIARFGEARCLAAMKRHKGLQSDLLRRAILDETELLPTVRHEVLHLIGRDLWREQTAIGSLDLLDDQTLVVPEWSADPLRLLDELPLLVNETPATRGPVEFQVLNVEKSDPDGISVRLNCSQARLETLIQRLARGCQLNFDISAVALEAIDGRSQHVAVNDRPLGLLLDGLTIPWGLVWIWKDKAIQIRHPSELTDDEIRLSRLAAAERILRIAVLEGVNSTQIGHSRLALSALLFEQGRAADGVQYLQLQIETAPRSVVASEAGFNLGKCLMVLNERDDAKSAFLRSVDASGGPIDVKVASYIFHCRMLLEEGHHKQAISTMMRGLNLSEGSEIEAWAALQLASAYLLDNTPTGANTVLMNHAESFAEGDARGAGAFVSALERFRKAVLVDRREREGPDVVAGMAEFNPMDAPG
ncbi:MAG: tetratricopeptide repeat protein, partial [Planctomycetota bacterium]